MARFVFVQTGLYNQPKDGAACSLLFHVQGWQQRTQGSLYVLLWNSISFNNFLSLMSTQRLGFSNFFSPKIIWSECFPKWSQLDQMWCYGGICENITCCFAQSNSFSYRCVGRTVRCNERVALPPQLSPQLLPLKGRSKNEVDLMKSLTNCSALSTAWTRRLGFAVQCCLPIIRFCATVFTSGKLINEVP